MNIKSILSIFILLTISIIINAQFNYVPQKIDSINQKQKGRNSTQPILSSRLGAYKVGLINSFYKDQELTNISKNDKEVKKLLDKAEFCRVRSLKNLRNIFILGGVTYIAIKNEENLYIDGENYIGAVSLFGALHQYFAAIVNGENARFNYYKARKLAGLNKVPVFSKSLAN